MKTIPVITDDNHAFNLTEGEAALYLISLENQLETLKLLENSACVTTVNQVLIELLDSKSGASTARDNNGMNNEEFVDYFMGAWRSTHSKPYKEAIEKKEVAILAIKLNISAG